MYNALVMKMKMFTICDYAQTVCCRSTENHTYFVETISVAACDKICQLTTL